jgi:hypothetical protein
VEFKNRKCIRNLLLRSLCKLSVRHRDSVFHAHADHDEHRVVLLRAALDQRHRSLWRNGKRRLLRVGRGAHHAYRRRCIARGTAGQVGYVIEGRA